MLRSFFQVLGLRRSKISLPLLASGIGALFRALPVVISWPYPAGYDTTASYLVQMTKPLPSLYVLFAGEAFHAAILSSLYKLDPTAFGAFAILNAFAIVLQALLTLEIYAYALKVAKLKPKFAFVAALVFTFNLVTMRLLWDQYRIALGLVFVLAIFLVLSSKRRFLGWTAIPLTILVFISNAEPAVFLALSLIVYVGVVMIQSKVVPKRSSLSRLNSAMVATALLAFVLLAVQISILRDRVNSGLPPNLTSQAIGAGASLSGVVYFVYLAWPLLLFVPSGLSKNVLSYHSIWFFGILFIAIVLPFLGSKFVFLPITWLYWIACFPLSILFGAALERYSSGVRAMTEGQKRRTTSLFAASIVVLLVLSMMYAISSPLGPDPYSVIGAPFAASQPLGYLQSTVPLSQEGDLVSVLNASLHSLPMNSTIYLGQQFYGLASVLPNPDLVHLVSIGLINSEDNLTSLTQYGSGYTIWWTVANKWYGVSAMPSGFAPAITEGTFTLYKF